MSATIEMPAAEATSCASPTLPFAAITAYALQDDIAETVLERARCVLLGALAELFAALNQVAAMRSMRALLPGNVQPGGARVPGTSYELEPCAAASAIGTLMSWAAERPMQNPLRAEPLAAMLAVADCEDRKRTWRGAAPLSVRELLGALIRAEQVRYALEQATSLAMSEHYCLLGGTTVATLSLLPGGAAQIGEALHGVWQAAASMPILSVCVHAEAVRRTFDGEAASLAAVIRHPLGDAFQARTIPDCTGDERRAVVQRFEMAVQTRLPLKQCERIKAIVADPAVFDGMAVNAFMAELVANQA